MLKIKLAALCGVTVAALSGAAAWAQVEPQGPPLDSTGETPAADEAGASTGRDVVVVTARGRDENLMDVPVSVSVLSGDDISKYNAANLSQIGDLTPTVIISSYKAVGGGSLAIRGISTPATQIGFEQAVSVSIDGVQTSNGRIGTVGFFDLSQVEVLKGPQALYFGRNSSAGVIALTSAGPTYDLEIGGRATYEFVGDEATIENYISGPITPTVGARLAVRYRDLKGWMYNDAKPIANPFFTSNMPAGMAQLPGGYSRRIGDDEILGRLTLTYEDDGPFAATFKVFGSHATDQGHGSAVQNIGPCPTGQALVYGIADPFSECRPDNHTSVGMIPLPVATSIGFGERDGRPYGETDVVFSTLNMNLDLGSANLVSTTGYSGIRNYNSGGFDSSVYSQLVVQEKNTEETLSQEFRLTGELSDQFGYMIGAYAQTTDLDFRNISKIRDSGYNAASGRFENWDAVASLKGNTVSVFAELDWNLTSDLQLSGGLRWTDEQRSFRKQNLYGIGGNNTQNTVFPGSGSGLGYIGDTFNDTNYSPEVTLSYRPFDDATIYVAYKTGFKSGGYALSGSLATTSTIADFDFGSETAEGFEIGAKGDLFDRRLRITSSLFDYQYKDLQVTTYDAATVTFKISNAGAVEQRGAEIEGEFDIGEALKVRGALTYVQNRFSDYIGQCYGYSIPAAQALTAAAPPGCDFALNASGGRLLTAAGTPVLQQNFDGRQPPRSPDWAGSAGFDYTADIGADMRLTFSGDAFYSDRYYAGDTAAPSTIQDAFWRFNASVRLSGPDDHWELALLGRNLTDEYYLLFAGDRTGGVSVPLTVGEQRGVVSRGREVALQLGYKF